MAGLWSMGVALLGTGGVLVAALVAGIIVHESSHVIVLQALGIPYEIVWFTGDAGLAMARPLVSVDPRPPTTLEASIGLRLAAIAPLTLAIPLALVLIGVLPDPLAMGNPYLTAATVGWAACALPSPQDFSVFWYGDR